jgi:hypothetical protein
VRNTIGINRIAQGAYNVVLAHQFIKLLGTPAPRDYLVAFFHRGLNKSSDFSEVARGFFKNFAVAGKTAQLAPLTDATSSIRMSGHKSGQAPYGT